MSDLFECATLAAVEVSFAEIPVSRPQPVVTHKGMTIHLFLSFPRISIAVTLQCKQFLAPTPRPTHVGKLNATRASVLFLFFFFSKKKNGCSSATVPKALRCIRAWNWESSGTGLGVQILYSG